MKLLQWFESLVKPFPEQTPGQPPKDLFGFCLYFLADAKKPLAFLSLTTFILAICEVSLYAILGQMVDWLSGKSPEASTTRTPAPPLKAIMLPPVGAVSVKLLPITTLSEPNM